VANAAGERHRQTSAGRAVAEQGFDQRRSGLDPWVPGDQDRVGQVQNLAEVQRPAGEHHDNKWLANGGNRAPDLELTALPFDFEEPRYELPTDNEHVLVFTCHSIEQITELPLEAITGLFGLGASLTVVHFEPIGWQIGGGTVAAATEEHSRHRRYNQNLWPLLGGLADAGEIQIETVAPDIIGLRTTIASSLVVWRR